MMFYLSLGYKPKKISWPFLIIMIIHPATYGLVVLYIYIFFFATFQMKGFNWLHLKSSTWEFILTICVIGKIADMYIHVYKLFTLYLKLTPILKWYSHLDVETGIGKILCHISKWSSKNSFSHAFFFKFKFIKLRTFKV